MKATPSSSLQSTASNPNTTVVKERIMSLHLRRTCRLFWCYQCQRSVRIISSPSFDVSFCPRCFGHFLHEVHLPHHPPPVVPVRPPIERRPEGSVPSLVHPGDYFAGPSLNELIDQLTQNDRPGPPPAPASAIDSMPVVTVRQAHLQEGSQCPVCKEDFEVGEEAREMPCKHVYHSDCIVPWLRLHNSCPVCRFQLPGGSGGGSVGGGNVAGGVGSVRRVPTRWNPIPSLWPFRGSAAARWEHDYLGGQEEEDPLESPGALCSWLRSWFLL